MKNVSRRGFSPHLMISCLEKSAILFIFFACQKKRHPVTCPAVSGIPGVYTPLWGAPRSFRELENSSATGGLKQSESSLTSSSFFGNFCGTRQHGKREMLQYDGYYIRYT